MQWDNQTVYPLLFSVGCWIQCYRVWWTILDCQELLGKRLGDGWVCLHAWGCELLMAGSALVWLLTVPQVFLDWTGKEHLWSRWMCLLSQGLKQVLTLDALIIPLPVLLLAEQWWYYLRDCVYIEWNLLQKELSTVNCCMNWIQVSHSTWLPCPEGSECANYSCYLLIGWLKAK